jgi:flagellar P-ring protein precursor FlgI
MRPRTLITIVLACLLAAAPSALGVSIQEITRLKGQGESILQGFGIVVGLPGTGDSGEDLVVARPLARLLESQGNPVGDFEELAGSRSIAIVVVTCTIPESGAKADDRFDVTVSAINNPESIEGGELFLTPLRGPLPGQPVFAIAQGPLRIEGATPTRARVRGGARIVQDVNMPAIEADGSITLIVRPAFAGWTTAQLLADTINQHRLGFDESAPDIAYAMDDRAVRVRIPAEELPDPANFIADIISVNFDGSLIDLPARVIVNEREGVIVATGDARISPVVISHNQMVVTTVNEARREGDPPPNLALTQAGRGDESAKVEDLLAAFRTLDVPVSEQIAILAELHRIGRMHAEFVVAE